jgi:hypothetical protein
MSMQTVAAMKLLMEKVDSIMEQQDETIISKTMIPVTGNKRTYVSISTYCWPTNKVNEQQGPWTCTDGKPNPQVFHLCACLPKVLHIFLLGPRN